MRTITLEQGLKKLAVGDLYHVENRDSQHSGWRLYLGKYNVGLTTELKGSWGDGAIDGLRNKITKFVFMEDMSGSVASDLSKFFHGYDEKHLERFMTTVVDEKQTKLEKLIADLESQLDKAREELKTLK